MSAAELSQVLMAFAVLVSSVAGLVVAVRTGQKVSATHDLVNGASEQLNALREARGHAAGVQEGLQRQGGLLVREPSGPLANAAPAGRTKILGVIPPASADVNAVAAAGNQPAASIARTLRQGRPKQTRRLP